MTQASPNRVVIATDSFKGTLTSAEAGRAIAAGGAKLWPHADIDVVPMADGGEGTVGAIMTAMNGTIRDVEVTGPLGSPITARFGLMNDGRTAVVEMASSSGLALTPPDQRDPTRTTTYGLGEQIAAALTIGARRVLIGIGGSATVDGGVGCAQALGITFLSLDGSPLTEPLAGGDLDRIAAIRPDGRDPRLGYAQIEVLCDVTNPLCGPNGAAAVYAPQKGATPAQVEQLDRNLAHLADRIRADLGRSVGDLPGAGAAGGLGAGLAAFFDATLHRGIDRIIELTRLKERIRNADLVITGEGKLDAQSSMGKAVSGVARCAREAAVPVIAIVGMAELGADAQSAGVDAVFTSIGPNEPIPASPMEARKRLATATETQLRSWNAKQRYD